MFYKTTVKDHIRVPPNLFGDNVEASVLKVIKEKYEGYISQEVGVVIDVSSLKTIGEGVIIPGDGASYYDSTFSLLSFKPEMHEVINGTIKDIADFGAFINLGPIEGMIHVSQTMDDFVTFSKEKVLNGRDSKRSLKVGDMCRARVVAVSFKDVTNPKLGLTMRQPGLGKLDWVEEDKNKKNAPVKETKTKKESK
ncbi:MAG TPA: DNA-directed RNA polymerase [Candidatus Nanoarchaeia archaeon]|nr:DNA-directed RNA polymerase [Candidatus Nanoarchaeia archaeon]